MITDADIKRINELYHKSKSEGLTPDEKQEQVKLREAYIESVRANMRRQLNNIDVKRPDGSIEYKTPVTYWMPFNGGIGLHDASWRSKFGGTIYQTSGSHGCVNLPPASAATLYDLLYKGIPVICTP